MKRYAAIFAGVWLIAASDDAYSCHVFSVWKFPYPQRCSIKGGDVPARNRHKTIVKAPGAVQDVATGGARDTVDVIITLPSAKPLTLDWALVHRAGDISTEKVK